MEPETFTDGESAAQRAATGLLKIGLAVKSRNWAEAGSRGLTPTQAQILGFLNTRFSTSASLGEIAAAMAITAPTASDSVSSLVGKGLVSKHRSEADRRAIMLTLTDAGRRMAGKVSDWTDFLVSAVGVLDPDEQRGFLKALVKIIRTLQVRGEIPLSRMCVTCRHFRPHAHPDPAAPHHCGFVGMAFGDQSIRIDCADHDPANDAAQDAAWSVFLGGGGRPQPNRETQIPDRGGNP